MRRCWSRQNAVLVSCKTHFTSFLHSLWFDVWRGTQSHMDYTSEQHVHHFSVSSCVSLLRSQLASPEWMEMRFSSTRRAVFQLAASHRSLKHLSSIFAMLLGKAPSAKQVRFSASPCSRFFTKDPSDSADATRINSTTVEDVMQRIHYVRCADHSQLLALSFRLQELISKSKVRSAYFCFTKSCLSFTS